MLIKDKEKVLQELGILEKRDVSRIRKNRKSSIREWFRVINIELIIKQVFKK